MTASALVLGGVHGMASLLVPGGVHGEHGLGGIGAGEHGLGGSLSLSGISSLGTSVASSSLGSSVGVSDATTSV